MNTSTRRSKPILQTIAALLLLPALPLVACTGDECVPGFKEGQTYEMTLTQASAISEQGIQSCVGVADVDNLTTGSVVDVYVPDGTRRLYNAHDECQVPIGQVTSDIGVTLGPSISDLEEPQTDLGAEMFLVNGQVTVQGCQLTWALEGEVIGSLANPQGMWAVRFITAEGPTFDTCSAQFPSLTAADFARCQDTWDVTLQTK